jgi:hypothetical protein
VTVVPIAARLRRRGSRLAALLLCGGTGGILGVSGRAQADDGSTVAPSPPPETVTVRGGSSAAGFVGRASLEDEPREVVDVGELLEGVSGAHVRRQGGEDGLATLSLRGTSSSEAAVVLAGVPLSGGGDPAIDLSTLPLWPGARVRVFRSFAPASLGPGSLGGTLALDPPSPQDPERTLVWVGVGSFGAARMRVGDVRTLGDGPDAPRVAVGLSASRASDDFSYYDAQLGHDVDQVNAQHAQVQALASYTLPFHLGASAREGDVTVTALAQARRQHLPGTFYLATPYQVLASDRELTSVQAQVQDGPGAVYARWWGRRDDLRLSDDPTVNERPFFPSAEDDAIWATGGALGWRGAPARGAKLDALVDASGEWFVPGEFSGAATPPHATRASIGTGVDASYALSPATTIAVTGRLDGWNDGSSGNASRLELRPTAHAGAETTFGPLAMAAHGGLLARRPSFLELYGDHGSFVGDPDLRTESAVTIDAGARVAGKTQDPAAHYWHASGDLDVSVFATWASDLITFVAQGAYGRDVATNIGRARILGVELGAHGEVGPFFARLAYTLLSTENESTCSANGEITSAAGACVRPPLPGRPSDDLVSDAGIHLGPVRARYGVDVVSGEYADTVGDIGVPARVLQSTGVSLDVPHVPGLRLAVDVRNLFDVRTGTYAGGFAPAREPIGDAYLYPLPGRSILATLRYETTR